MLWFHCLCCDLTRFWRPGPGGQASGSQAGGCQLRPSVHFCPCLPVRCCFFVLSRYWRYSEEMKTMDPGYPKPITIWKGIPDSPQGAFVHKENGFTYFYKGKEYWKFNNQILKVEPGYPRSILKDFMGCDGPTDRHKEGHSPTDDVDIVIKLDNTAGTVRAVAIVIPCVLALCLLVLVFTVLRFKRKGTPRHILYCKRSMQEWV
uniref:Matrix metallopeptidase 16 n=1 Tax=Molossus molossus TaxID=27622 RepID=A0A7J8DTM7_MOLMO|nr:matrix metallopeptidase 16 [Molossus molossus]